MAETLVSHLHQSDVANSDADVFRQPSGFRRDVEGLRAVAVGLFVAGHVIG